MRITGKRKKGKFAKTRQNIQTKKPGVKKEMHLLERKEKEQNRRGKLGNKDRRRGKKEERKGRTDEDRMWATKNRQERGEKEK